jgi:hypothetical protein
MMEMVYNITIIHIHYLNLVTNISNSLFVSHIMCQSRLLYRAALYKRLKYNEILRENSSVLTIKATNILIAGVT